MARRKSIAVVQHMRDDALSVNGRQSRVVCNMVSQPSGCDTDARATVFCEVRGVRSLRQIVCIRENTTSRCNPTICTLIVPAEMNKRPFPGSRQSSTNDRVWVDTLDADQATA